MKLETVDPEIRQRVLAAAQALFYARGIQDVGMDDIRAASGVSLKRLYQQFGSKDELVAGYLELMGGRWRSGLAQFVDAEDDPRAKLLAVFDFLSSWFAEDDFRGCAFVNCFGELGATSAAVSDAARAHKQQFRDQLGALVAGAGGPPELAEHVALLAEGAITTSAIAGSPVPAQRAKEAAAVLIDAALGAAPARRGRAIRSSGRAGRP